MSKNETIKIKYSKIKNFEQICSYFSQDYTAKETSLEVGISRQTINYYYQILREKTNEEFISFDDTILEKLLKSETIYIRHINIYKTDIFYLQDNDKILILDEKTLLKSKLHSFIESSVNKAITKHKRANCARVITSHDKKTFFLSVLLKNDDYVFEEYLLGRLKKFRGINKEKLSAYLKESQIRYNSTPSIIYQELLSNLKNN